jgi:hypothetical protein
MQKVKERIAGKSNLEEEKEGRRSEMSNTRSQL